MADTFLIKRNDTSPSLEAQLLDSAKEPVPITGASVKFYMGTADGETLVDGEAAVIVDGATGVVRYDWQAGDTLQEGRHRGEFEVTFLDGKVETFPKSAQAARNFITIIIPEDV